MAADLAEEPPICEGTGHGIFFPIGGDAEQELDDSLRALIYGFALFYCFMGVSIVADTFMSAIEAITSRKQRVFMKELGRHMTVQVWNDTVANLTLMALGSSAPEILLAVLEIVKRGCYSGELGPSTIIGSAAFNLLVIVATCMVAVPREEVRIIKEVSVFLVTAVFSIWAYVWLLVIVTLSSPGVIDVWEGAMTLGFLPVLVGISYVSDLGWFSRSSCDHGEGDIKAAEAGDTFMYDHNENLSAVPSPKANICPGFHYSEHSSPDGHLHLPKDKFETTSESGFTTSGSAGTEGKSTMSGELRSIAMRVQRRADGSCMNDQRHSNSPGLRTIRDGCGSASMGLRVSNPSAVVVRGSRVSLGGKRISANSRPSVGGSFRGSVFKQPVGIRRNSKTLPAPMALLRAGELILDSCGKPILNQYGIVTFSADTLDVSAGLEDRTFAVPVYRCNGSTGLVSCQYRTEALSAVPGYDYKDHTGRVTFEHGVKTADVSLTVLPKRLGERSDQFQLVLERMEGGASFNPNDDGGRESSVLTVTIHNENEGLAKNLSDKALGLFEGLVNLDEARLGSATWAEQIKDAVSSCLPQEECTAYDQLVVWLLAPWRILYSIFVPPTVYCGGWVCFVLSLVHIGVLTAFVGDLAELFGCVAGIKDSVTAITFVALGTSMPDLFASRTAAMQDEYADASIVNVTGSNSVNVFLGLGLPWTMGAVYWKVTGATDKWRRRYPDLLSKYPQGAFAVRSGELTFSVIVFTIAACCALAVIWCRRIFLGGELGGQMRWASAFLMFMFWSFYLGLCIWRSTAKSVTLGQEVLGILIGLVIVFASCMVYTFLIRTMNRYQQRQQEAGAVAADDATKGHEGPCCPKAPNVCQVPTIAPPQAPPPNIVVHEGDSGMDWITQAPQAPKEDVLELA